MKGTHKEDFTSMRRLVVGDVKRPEPPNNFPGLYVLNFDPMSNNFIGEDLPVCTPFCDGLFTSDNKRVLVTTFIGFQAVIVVIRLDSGDVTTLTPVGMTSPSYALRYHCDGIMIAVRTSFTMAPQLVARRIDSDDEWKPLSQGLQPEVEPCVREALEDLEQIEIKFQPDHYPAGRPDSPVDCEAILIRKKNWTGWYLRDIHCLFLSFTIVNHSRSPTGSPVLTWWPTC